MAASLRATALCLVSVLLQLIFTICGQEAIWNVLFFSLLCTWCLSNNRLSVGAGLQGAWNIWFMCALQPEGRMGCVKEVLGTIDWGPPAIELMSTVPS